MSTVPTGRAPMRLTESSDSVVAYRLRASWRVALLLVSLAVAAPLAIGAGGDLNALPGPLAAATALGFIGVCVGAIATAGLGTSFARRRVERRTTGDLAIDVEEPVLRRGNRGGPTSGGTAVRTLELAPRQVLRVVVERSPGSTLGSGASARDRVAIDLADGRAVYPWWSFRTGPSGQAFMRDAAQRMHEVMRLDGDVGERDTVAISTFDAAAYAQGGATAASVEARWADGADPLNPVHTLAQRAFAVSVDSAVCLLVLIGVFWLAGTRPDAILIYALPAYGALRLAYHTVYEGLWGATLGKRLARLRVVAVDGGPVGAGRAFKRNLARIVDAIAFYLVALVVAAQPGPTRSQRLGDRWAGTLVVDERRVEATLAAHRVRA